MAAAKTWSRPDHADAVALHRAPRDVATATGRHGMSDSAAVLKLQHGPAHALLALRTVATDTASSGLADASRQCITAMRAAMRVEAEPKASIALRLSAAGARTMGQSISKQLYTILA
eukprot:CAMPEP_0198539056 /NCGR_PEP_ID=MMETSP1462-20131121/48204_1 /TAXON_ID=1333877 /ORGANISM="Brandtodinium nutriculum, Strain RCC3387" /LENGTH=116 /DNA_ID=CAMNT_0044269097 /DNA_START=339 /DNA_END=690 /DNA_ORIENTATION=-